jgi:hypothetical protein
MTMQQRWIGRVAGLAAAVALGAAAVSTVEFVQAQSTQPAVMYACVLNVPNPGNNPPLGSMRMIRATETCRANETAVNWNQQGVPGPASTSIVQKEFTIGNLDFTGKTTLDCPAGAKVLGGGVRWVSGGDGAHGLAIGESYPTDNDTWFVRENKIYAVDFSKYTLSAYAICGA